LFLIGFNIPEAHGFRGFEKKCLTVRNIALLDFLFNITPHMYFLLSY
jgi:hypothetical protein